MIKAVIIEDEQRNIHMLQQMLEKYCPSVEILGAADSVDSGFSIIKSLSPELVFLDIEIVGGNAFSLLNKLQPINFEIIFITAYDSYAITAIKYSALDYILKPVNIDELIAAVDKANHRLHTSEINKLVTNLLSNSMQARKENFSLALLTNKGYEIFAAHEIIRCEADSRGAYFYLTRNRKLFADKTLREYEDILPDSIFFRAHTTHLINIEHIKRYRKEKNIVVEMSDGSEVPVAIRRKNEFLHLFGNAS